MGIRTFSKASMTTDAVADTSALTDGKFLAIQGGSSTQRVKIIGATISGLEANTSAPQIMLLARDSTIGTNLTALTTGESDEEDDPSTSALSSPVLVYTTAGTTQPQRAKKYLANMSFNAIGGVHIRRFPYGQEPQMLGNTADDGEVSLSGFTGTTAGLVAPEIKYEAV